VVVVEVLVVAEAVEVSLWRCTKLKDQLVLDLSYVFCRAFATQNKVHSYMIVKMSFNQLSMVVSKRNDEGEPGLSSVKSGQRQVIYMCLLKK